MSIFRKDPTSARWVIVAGKRQFRPSDFDVAPTVTHEPKACPFCAGNEANTPAEVFAIRTEMNGLKDSIGWEVRVIPNKYPAVMPEADFETDSQGLLLQKNGKGYHEVVIESPDHYRELEQLSEDHVYKVIQAWISRLNYLYGEQNVDHVLLFKNKGQAAGASLSHPHSQLVGLPFIPPEIAQSVDIATKHFKKDQACLSCQLVEQEIAFEQRIIELTEEFVVYAPFASRFPYEVHILPRFHQHDFTQLSPTHQRQFVRILQQTLQRLGSEIKDVSYNLVLQNTPNLNRHPDSKLIKKSYHWQLEILPRLTTQAGFEWGTGIFINPFLPETVAQTLRQQHLAEKRTQHERFEND